MCNLLFKMFIVGEKLKRSCSYNGASKGFFGLRTSDLRLVIRKKRRSRRRKFWDADAQEGDFCTISYFFSIEPKISDLGE